MPSKMIKDSRRLRMRLLRILRPTYKIKEISHYFYRYREGEYMVDMEVDFGWAGEISDANARLMICADTITRWKKPHEDKPITDEKRDQILERLAANLRRYERIELMVLTSENGTGKK